MYVYHAESLDGKEVLAVYPGISRPCIVRCDVDTVSASGGLEVELGRDREDGGGGNGGGLLRAHPRSEPREKRGGPPGPLGAFIRSDQSLLPTTSAGNGASGGRGYLVLDACSPPPLRGDLPPWWPKCVSNLTSLPNHGRFVGMTGGHAQSRKGAERAQERLSRLGGRRTGSLLRHSCPEEGLGLRPPLTLLTAQRGEGSN